jgi:hypothetical protein
MLTSTADTEAHFIKVLVHGPSGAGKTRLAATVNKPLIISCESGLLSLREYDLAVWKVSRMEDLQGAYQEALKPEYEWIVLDSISEIAEVCLAEEKRLNKDARKAYGEMQDTMGALVRSFRDLPKHVYMSAKQAKLKDEVTGAMLYSPDVPSARLANGLPYFFDEVFALHSWKNDEGIVERSLQTTRDNQYDAKDRSGSLDFWEEADLGKIQKKILNEKDD